MTSHLRVLWSQERRDRCGWPNKGTKEDSSDVGLCGDNGDIMGTRPAWYDMWDYLWPGTPKNGNGDMC